MLEWAFYTNSNLKGLNRFFFQMFSFPTFFSVSRPYLQRSLDKCALAGEWARERAREHWRTGTYAADGYFTFARASLAASASAAMARCSWTGRRTSLLQMIQCYDYWRPWAFLLQKAVHTTVKVIVYKSCGEPTTQRQSRRPGHTRWSCKWR